MRIVVETAAWFEFVSDDVLDPDTAVKQLEAIAFQLQQLGPGERRELVAFVEREAAAANSVDYQAFLRAFPDALGLDEDA